MKIKLLDESCKVDVNEAYFYFSFKNLGSGSNIDSLFSKNDNHGEDIANNFQ